MFGKRLLSPGSPVRAAVGRRGADRAATTPLSRLSQTRVFASSLGSEGDVPKLTASALSGGPLSPSPVNNGMAASMAAAAMPAAVRSPGGGTLLPLPAVEPLPAAEVAEEEENVGSAWNEHDDRGNKAFGEVEVEVGKTYNEQFKVLLGLEAYRCPETFEKEQKQIFRRQWVPLGYTNEFDFRGKTVICREMYGQQVLVTRDKQGEIRVFYNTCRHRGHTLAQKDLNQNVLVCPYHAWKFRLDGSLASATRVEDPSFDKSKMGLYEVKTEIVGNLILANFSPNPADHDPVDEYIPGFLQDIAPYPLQDMKISKQGSVEVKANWKLAIDNFIEYYHLPTVHPGLVQISNMEGHQCTQKPGNYIGFVTSPITCSKEPAPADPLPERLGPFFDSLHGAVNSHGHDLTQSSTFHSLFPNMFWFLFPNHAFSVIVEPIDAHTCRESCTLFVRKDFDHTNGEYQKNLDALWDYYQTVNNEDIHACEQVMKGIKSNPVMERGVYVWPYEKTIRRFHEMYLKQMKR